MKPIGSALRIVASTTGRAAACPLAKRRSARWALLQMK
jgi:hypothetical protein